MENQKKSDSSSKSKVRLGRISNQVRGNASPDEHEEEKEYSTANTRKKILPNRKNRGEKLKLLTSNEGNLEEDEFYNNIFQEESSDEDFNPSQTENESDEESLNSYQKAAAAEGNEEEKQIETEHEEKNHFEMSSNLIEESGEGHRKKEEEMIYDIDQLDIDKIDEIEEMRDRGIDVDNMDLDEMDDEEFSAKKKKKKKSKSKKKNEKGSNNNNINSKSILLVENNENKTISRAFIDDDEDEEISKKRNRSSKFSKIIIHKKQSKKEKNNPNVQITGNKFKPYSIKIFKSAFLPENEECECECECECEEKDDIMKYNDEGYKQHYNLDQEKDTQSIIKKYKKQEVVEPGEKKYSWIQDKPSQKDLLFEAIFTEYYNMKSLEAMQRLDDLNKRDMSTSNKKKFTDYVKIVRRVNNPQTNIDSCKEEHLKEDKVNDTDSFLTFSNTDIYSKIFEPFNKKGEPKEKKLCAITGKPAKYFDPLTKQYYLSAAEFKILRERYFQKEEDGLLFRIQTLSDLASQKKEKLKKMILSDDTTGGTSASSTSASANINANAILNIVNKFGILKNDSSDFEKRAISRKYLK